MENILSVLNVPIDIGIVILMFSLLGMPITSVRGIGRTCLTFGSPPRVYICFLAMLGAFLGDTALARGLRLPSIRRSVTTLLAVLACS